MDNAINNIVQMNKMHDGQIRQIFLNENLLSIEGTLKSIFLINLYQINIPYFHNQCLFWLDMTKQPKYNLK